VWIACPNAGGRHSSVTNLSKKNRKNPRNSVVGVSQTIIPPNIPVFPVFPDKFQKKVQGTHPT
jgi:hypothetical protein